MKKKFLVPAILVLAALTVTSCGPKEEEEFDEEFDDVSSWDGDATPDEISSSEAPEEDEELKEYEKIMEMQATISGHLNEDPLADCSDPTYESFVNYLNETEYGYSAETLENVEPKEEWLDSETTFMLFDVTLDNRKDMLIVTKDGKLSILQYLEDYKDNKQPGIYVYNTDVLIGSDSIYLFNMSGDIFEIVDVDMYQDIYNICHLDVEKGVVTSSKMITHMYDKGVDGDVGTFSEYDAETGEIKDITLADYNDFMNGLFMERLGRPDSYILDNIR